MGWYRRLGGRHGPSLGAAIVSAGGWRWAFFVNIPVGLFVLLFGRRVLSESVGDSDSKRPDYLGVGLMSLALASLVLAISEGSTWGWTDGRILCAFAVRSSPARCSCTAPCTTTIQ